MIVDTDDILDLFGASDEDIYAKRTIEDAIYDGTLHQVEPEPKQRWWIPCYLSELPKNKMLWVTHDNGEYRWVEEVCYDKTRWSSNVSDVIAYMIHEEEPEPYKSEEDQW